MAGGRDDEGRRRGEGRGRGRREERRLGEGVGGHPCAIPQVSSLQQGIQVQRVDYRHTASLRDRYNDLHPHVCSPTQSSKPVKIPVTLSQLRSADLSVDPARVFDGGGKYPPGDSGRNWQTAKTPA